MTDIAAALRSSARRHPAIFPLLLLRPATTPESHRVRETVYDALREAGLAEESVARVERLLVTAILGFAVSEVAGRFSNHSPAVLDADCMHLLAMLESALLAERDRA